MNKMHEKFPCRNQQSPRKVHMYDFPGSIPFTNPCIVGYKGEIGSFLLQGLLRIMPKASSIWCYDIGATKQEQLSRLRKADVVFLCVPIQHTRRWIVDHQSVFRGNKRLIEQASVKEPILKGLMRPGMRILSMHLLFRPSATPNPEDRRVAFIESPQWRGADSVIARMTESQPIYYATLQEHDREMAIIQALTHCVVKALDQIHSTGRGTSYMSLQIKRLADRMAAGDPELYQWIQRNPYAAEAIKLFQNTLENTPI